MDSGIWLKTLYTCFVNKHSFVLFLSKCHCLAQKVYKVLLLLLLKNEQLLLKSVSVCFVFFVVLRVEIQKKKSRENTEQRKSGGEEVERGSKGSGEMEDDPYGGSTDENTDAEEEEDKPIPELPGLPVKFFCQYYL